MIFCRKVRPSPLIGGLIREIRAQHLGVSILEKQASYPLSVIPACAGMTDFAILVFDGLTALFLRRIIRGTSSLCFSETTGPDSGL